MLYLRCQTNNLCIMKKFHSFDSDLLTMDVCDYLFVEWLVRHELYSKFVRNLTSRYDDLGRGRLLVRRYIRHFVIPHFRLENAISSAFVFAKTPEGFDFWKNVSDEWVKFCSDFFYK